MPNKSHASSRPENAVVEATHEDELIHVPKGNSALRFVLTFIVVVFVLVMFTVTGPMMATFEGRNTGDEPYMVWTDPSGTQRSLTEREFVEEKRGYTRLLDLIMGQRGDVNDENLATFLVEEKLAKDSGIIITDQDVAKFLRDRLGVNDTAAYNDYVQRGGLTIKEFEELLRRQLRVERYRYLLTTSARLAASPKDVLKQWQDRYREYRFEYARATPDMFTEAARAELPDEAGLRAWYDALSESEKATFRTEPKYEADFAVYYVGGEVPETLLGKNPPEEGSDPEEQARSYYDLVHQYRFARPKVDGEPESESPYLPFDEVADEARTEAPIYFAMDKWRAQLASMARNDQVVDLVAEAVGVGLVHEDDQVARTFDEWTKFQAFGSTRLATQLQQTGEGRFAPSVVATPGALVVARVLRVLAPRVQEFDEVREKVEDAWAKQQAARLALAKLQEVYDGMKPAGSDETAPVLGGIDVSEEAFAQAVADAGLELQVRDWRDRVTEPEGGWVDAEPIESFLRLQANAFTLADGQVMAPAEDRRNGGIYLVRLAGSREPQGVAKKPGDFEGLRNRVAGTAQQAFETQAFGFEHLAQEYDLHFALREQPVDLGN